MNREPVESLYEKYCSESRASSPHLPTLRRYAARCRSCAEFGVKDGASASALLLGCPGPVYGFDIKETSAARKLQSLVGKTWVYTICDTREAVLPECDLLFLDSMHNYDHVRAELEIHAEKVRKYLIFHDTITFGSVGALDESGNPASGTLGIRPAIDELMMRDRSWFIERHDYHSHGLLVLERRHGDPD